MVWASVWALFAVRVSFLAAESGLTFEELTTSCTLLISGSNTNDEPRHRKHFRSGAIENMRSTSSDASRRPSISIGTV